MEAYLFDKYADIVKHIVMHYNQGWANGFSYGIRYFEIWNEPDFLPFWAGTADQYHELYAKIALAIQSVESKALIGGPANSTFNDKMGTRASLMKYVRDNKLPFDFYSYHKYTNKSQDPMDYARMARSFREELDSFGFEQTQIMNTEYESSLEQYRIDASKDMKQVSTKTIKAAERTGGSITISGTWASSGSDPAQGVDLVIVKKSNP